MKNQDFFNRKDRKYSIVSYDTNWLKRFAEEAKIIRNIFGKDIQIEHIGSTSVPNMVGKSCIDLLVTPKDIKIVKNHISDMEKAGYKYRGELIKKDTLLFSRLENNLIKTNVHFFPQKLSNDIAQILIIRDYLRNHPEEVTQYSALKMELYKKYPNDYKMYRKQKDNYMSFLIQRAKNSHKE